MSDTEKINQAIALIEHEQSLSDRPALVVMPPDSKSFLIGNRGGFLNLAIAAIKAAEGQKQLFKNEPWFVVEDYDWGLAGLTPDEDAHIYLPTPQTTSEKLTSKVWGVVLPLCFGIPLIVGIGTIASWLMHLIHLL